jgi:hypothetical protein
MTTIIVTVWSRCTQARMKAGPYRRSCRMYASGATISPRMISFPSSEHQRSMES